MIPNWTSERRKMVESQLVQRGIRDSRVLAAMSEIPREQFVPPEFRLASHGDGPVDIGYGQTISQPYMTALMAQALELGGGEAVLEVGSGCGYAAAVLGRLAAWVITVEIIPELAERARRNLTRTGCGVNVRVVDGDGGWGRAEDAPYDAISVAAAAPDIPAPLLDQLADPGVLVIPVGGRDDQELLIIHKRAGRLERRTATQCRFVPLRGGEGWH